MPPLLTIEVSALQEFWRFSTKTMRFQLINMKLVVHYLKRRNVFKNIVCLLFYVSFIHSDSTFNILVSKTIFVRLFFSRLTSIFLQWSLILNHTLFSLNNYYTIINNNWQSLIKYVQVSRQVKRPLYKLDWMIQVCKVL